MKKHVLFTFGILMFVFTNAQHVQAGFTSSLNFNSISGAGMQSTMEVGYSAGIYVDLPVNQKVYLEPGVLFSQNNINTGSDFYSVYPETARTNFRQGVLLNYINVPVLAGYRLNKQWTVQAGPQYSYLVGSDERLLNTDKRAFKKDDISMVAGVEWHISALKLYGRYNYGISNINNVNDVRQWNSRQVQFGIGWRFL